MSLITLRSQINELSAESIDNSYIQNTFKEGLTVNPTDTVSLVSLSMNKQNKINISDGNDTLIWRFGGRAQFAQHVVKLTHGSYTPEEMTTVLQSGLDDSVLIGVFKRQVGDATKGFNVEYDSTANPKEWTITMTVQSVPITGDGNLNTFEVHENLTETNNRNDGITEADTPVANEKGYEFKGLQYGTGKVDLNGPDSPFDTRERNNINVGDKGVFANGGMHGVVSFSQNGIEEIYGSEGWDYTTVPTLKGIQQTGTQFPEFLTLDVDIDITDASTAQQALGWDYKIRETGGLNRFLKNDGSRVPEMFLRMFRLAGTTNGNVQNGIFVMGSDGTVDATDASNWDSAIPYWCMVKLLDGEGSVSKLGQLVSLEEDSAGNPIRPPNGELATLLSTSTFEGCRILNRDGTPLTVQFDGSLGHNPVSIGFARTQLFDAVEADPTNPDAYIQSGIADQAGYDVVVSCTPNFESSEHDPQIEVGILLKRAGSTYYSANWRQPKLLYSKKASDVFGATWNNNDVVRLDVEVSGLTGIITYASFSSDGGGTWSAQTVLVETSTSPITLPDGSSYTWNNTIKEEHFPLRPVFCMCSGGHYSMNRQVSSGDYANSITVGLYDREEYTSGSTSSVSASNNEEGDDATTLVHAQRTHLTQTDGSLARDVSLTAEVAINLSTMWKLGAIRPQDIDSSATSTTTIHPDDVIPNIASIMPTIAFPRLFKVLKSATSGTPCPISKGGYIGNSATPNLTVELLNFNNSGRNGANGDTNKAIAVIPREQLTTGDTSGTLHYNARFPIKIDLNVSHQQTIYSMTAVLRDSDGNIVKSLNYPTELTLLFEKSEQTKMEAVIERMINKMGDQQQTLIDNIGIKNPRV